jgi:hypothetical protein
LVVGAGTKRCPVGGAGLAVVEHLAKGIAVKYANLWSAGDVVHDVQIVVIGVLTGGVELPCFERNPFSPSGFADRLYLNLPWWTLDVVRHASIVNIHRFPTCVAF